MPGATMKIQDYIKKHEVTGLPHSLTQPVAFPAALLEHGLTTSFTGMNKDRSIAVALYKKDDLFVVLEQKIGRRITGKISVDCPGLD